MPLFEDYQANVQIRLGLTVPSLSDQAKSYGLILSNDQLWEDRHRAWNLLRLGGFLTDAEADRIAYRLIKGVGRELGYEVAISDLALQLLAANEEAIVNAGQEPVKEEPATKPQPSDDPALDALDNYLKTKQAD